MVERTAWRSWILGPLLGLRIMVSLKYVVASVVPIYLEYLRQRRGKDWSFYLASLSPFICLCLESMEISRFHNWTLTPSFYLLAQTIKSTVFTCSLLRLLWLRKSYRYRRLLVAEELLDIMVFYVSLLYALYIFIRQKPIHRAIFARWKGSARNDSAMVGKVDENVLLPHLVNSSQHIRADSMIIVQALGWLNANRGGRERQSPLRISLLYIWFFLKYTICYMVFLIMLALSPRLPGEELHPFQVGPHSTVSVVPNSHFNDWNYLKPDVRHDDAEDMVDIATTSRRLRDEESITDNINLQGVTQHSASIGADSRNRIRISSSPPRLLGPRYLCFLAEAHSDESEPKYIVKRVDNWLVQDKSGTSLDYIFVSYTRRQFNTQLKPGFFNTKEQDGVEKDRMTLVDFAIRAAKAAKVPAFWVDFECVRPEDNADIESDMEDVYRICDVVRASHSVAIVLGPSLGNDNRYSMSDPSYRTQCLHEWGQRLWTVPEALLCPSEHRIAIYAVGSPEPELVAKRNLAVRVWDDANALRQLIDHYESSLHLTQLELISIALDCLQRRQTETRNAGDVTYVLMGLLRIRLPVNKLDSQFQAFAKLSLANDTDRMLERVICVRNSSLAWNDLDDLWNSKLWHINPLYQIANVGQDDTVSIQGAVGATIDWQSLKIVDFKLDVEKDKQKWRIWTCRYASMLFFSFAFAYWFLVYQVASVLHMQSKFHDAIWIQCLIPVSIGLFVSLPTPYSLSQHFRQKASDRQARLFGLKGRPTDLDEVESHIFGTSCGRLKWNSSEDVYGHAEDENENENETNDHRPEYTLIDTLTCTATPFRASNPPAMLFAGAGEGGLMRTILCSYDQKRRVFVKETVVRMKNAMLKRLPHLDGFNMTVTSRITSYKDQDNDGVDRIEVDDTVPEGEENFHSDPDAIDIPEIPEFRSLDDLA